jgi:hypothetical protein
MAGICAGLWTLEVPDHALGRAVERSGFLHPGAIIREAHKNLLDLPATIISERLYMINTDGPGIYIKAGPGCFVGHLIFGMDANEGHSVHVRVKTWLSDDQLHENQTPLCKKGETGDRLGDCWLLPQPFRLIEEEDGHLHIASWKRLR